jgi:CHASE2 domain-containing sensor protein
MLENAACPDPAKLTDYARNTLAPQDVRLLDEHLARCQCCLTRFAELPRPALGPQVPGCRVIKEIGRGRFGVVYKAWRLTENPRLVALKVLSYAGEMERNRFEREIAVLKKINSPWIVKCLESGAAGDTLYFIMDFVEGIQLDEYLASSGGSLSERLAVFQRVCRAVADAHEQGVVHRDLKPVNILIDASGLPHILDFGICTVAATDWSSWERYTITHPGDIVGTLKYMSPEQAWGGVAGPIDERTDLWSLGVMLYEIITGGEHPYSLSGTPDKPPHEALLERIRRELPKLPRLGFLPRGRDLEVLLERCLAWERDHRIESAAKLADDLDRYRNGRRINTKPLWLPYRLKRLAVGAAARSRWMFSAGFVAATAMALWVTFYLFHVGWTVTGTHYQGSKSSAAGPAGPVQARDRIVLAGVFDDTIDAVMAFASGRNIAGVTPDVRTWRAVHGHLMERLAPARPQAVVWDYFFATPRPGDQSLVAGVRKLEDAGTPVILAALTYREDGSPHLSPSIAEPLGAALRHGAIVARGMVLRSGEVILVIKRPDGTIIPGLALTTLAAILHPHTRLDLDWPNRKTWMNLLYEIPSGAYLRDRDRIEFTTVYEEKETQYAVRPGDVLACTKFTLELPETWQQRTIPYQSLLSCSDDDLRQQVEDRVVIVGDMRPPRPGFDADFHRVMYGVSKIEEVPGCYLLADAVAGLLDRRYMKSAFLPLPATFLSMLVLAAVGCLLPIRLATTELLHDARHRRLVWAGLLGLWALCFLMLIGQGGYAVVHLGMAGLALLSPLLGSLWVELARSRHRVLDRKRLALEGLGLSTAGTVTLASQPARSSPKVG